VNAISLLTQIHAFIYWRAEADDSDLNFALCICSYLALRQARRTGKVITAIEVERGGPHATDPTRVGGMREAEKGGRWVGLIGFRV
jgi:hypothetical protein